MFCIQGERAPKQIYMKSLDFPDYCQDFFVTLGILLLSFVSVLYAKAMSRWVPLFITWDKTVPIPTGDASQARGSGRLGS